MLSLQHQSRPLQFTFCSIFFSLLVLILLQLNGCGMMNSSMMQGTTASFAFVTNSGSGTVSVFAVSTTGMMTPVSGSPFSPAQAQSLWRSIQYINFFLQAINSKYRFSVFGKHFNWNADSCSRISICHRHTTNRNCRGSYGKVCVCREPGIK